MVLGINEFEIEVEYGGWEEENSENKEKWVQYQQYQQREIMEGHLLKLFRLLYNALHTSKSVHMIKHIALTSSLASAMVFCSSNDITNKNVQINVGSTVNCSVIAFRTEVRKSVRGHNLAANRTHTYIVGPIIAAPYMLNLYNTREK